MPTGTADRAASGTVSFYLDRHERPAIIRLQLHLNHGLVAGVKSVAVVILRTLVCLQVIKFGDRPMNNVV